MYTTIAWLPFLAVAIGVLWVLMSGLEQLEMISFGTEFFVGNDETTNMMKPLGGVSDEELLMDALNSGDVEQMSAALDQVGSDREQLAAAMG
ncbi:MAG: hypothetical protein GX557_00930 [Chloroflexi bacterium]|nr:hypothetical protein [Chloroflexota bacterium]